MTPREVQTLAEAVKAGPVIFLHPSDDNAAFIVDRVGEHPEEGKGHPCAIFKGGQYAALDNCHLSNFAIISRLAHP